MDPVPNGVMSEEEKAEKKKLKEANDKIAQMLAEDEAKKQAKEEAEAKENAEAAALNNGKNAAEAATKEFDAQKALEAKMAEIEEK